MAITRISHTRESLFLIDQGSSQIPFMGIDYKPHKPSQESPLSCAGILPGVTATLAQSQEQLQELSVQDQCWAGEVPRMLLQQQHSRVRVSKCPCVCSTTRM